MAAEVVKHVVLDAGAFLRNAPIQNIAENAYTVEGVVQEIRCKQTRQRLQVLPYQLKFRQPSTEAIKAVTDFSKKTGDYRSLSAVDIQVMALAYQLEKEHVGTDHLKTVPDRKVQWDTSGRPLEKATDIAGFYVKSKPQKPDSGSVSESSSDQQGSDTAEITLERLQLSEINAIKVDTVVSGETSAIAVTEVNVESIVDSEETVNTTQPSMSKEESRSTGVREGQVISAECLQEEYDTDEEGSEEEEDEDEDDDDDDDDDEGWITPSNIKDVKEKMGMVDMTKAVAQIPVGCLTLDFAMQNVLIQMGMNVISVDGMLIKRAKSYVLRCYACMKITTHLQKKFCPHCGNSTLTKVSMTVNEDGSIRYFLSRRRRITTRGTKVPLPRHRGGKHASNPIFVEDQPVPQQRSTKKSMQKLDMFSPDYVANTSPFSLNDVTSRAAQLGIKGGWNQNSSRQGRRK